MFIPSLDTKYSISLCNFSGHLVLGHFRATIPSSLIRGVPQTGHSCGICIISSLPVLSSVTTFTTCGIISAAFSTITLSPFLISFLIISSKLCKLARLTTEPDNSTASSSATGVTTPVLPT